MRVNVLYDIGSNLTLVRRSLIRRLGITGAHTLLSLATAGGGQTKVEPEIECKFKLRSLNRNFTSHLLTATTCKQPIDSIQRVTLSPADYGCLSGMEFTYTYPQLNETIIHIILDTNNCLNFWEGEVKGGGNESPKVICSRLGNILAGSYLPHSIRSPKPPPCGATFPRAIAGERVEPITEVLSRFWELEHLGILPVKEGKYTEEEDEAMREMKRVTVYDPKTKSYTTQLLFKKDPSCLSNNLPASKAMALSSHRRYKRTNTLDMVLSAYQEKITMGFAEELTDPREIADISSSFYAPTHAVIKPHSTSFKVRVVQNSSHASPGGQCLNDILHKGPDLMPSLIAILVRFRCYPVYVSSDISRQFWRITVAPHHRDYMRYVFYDETDRLKHCRSLTLVFGMISSPFQSMYCVQDLGATHQKEYPRAAQVVKTSLYQDDAGFGTNCEKEAAQTAKQLYELLLLGSFPTHKWSASDHNILKQANIPEEKWAPGDSQGFLGLDWLQGGKDEIRYDFRNCVQTAKRYTLREMCSTAAKIFDPLGHFCAATTTCKLYFRRAVEADVKWDDELPEDIKSDYIRWREMVQNMTPFSIPRPAFYRGEKQFLVGMSDASKDCYAAAIYACSPSQVRLIVAKSRITPLRGKNSQDLRLTIPRLEMMGIEISTSLASMVKEAMPQGTFEDTLFFTDSRISLLRIQNGADKYKIFIAARIRRILSRTTADKVMGIAGHMNPSDAPTRCRTMEEIRLDDLWWRAPLWLRRPKSEWPIHKAYTKEQCREMESLDALEIAKTTVSAAVTAQCAPHSVLTLLDNKCSKFLRIQRIFSYILRFLVIKIPSLSTKSLLLRNAIRQIGPLRVSELRMSAKVLYRVAQRNSFKEQLVEERGGGISIKPNAPLLRLGAYIDATDGLIRLKTRLSLSETVGDAARSPILLPRPANCPLTRKIILSVHEVNLHAGPSTTMYILQKAFHVTGGLKAIAYCISKQCGNRACRRLRRPQVEMAPLPAVRSHSYTPWDSVGTDYAGPFDLMPTKTQLATKAYCILFCDQVTRAVHTEVVTDMTTNTFLLAFRRLVSLKGVPSYIQSDNAKTYTSANRKLTQLYRKIDQKQLQEEASKRQCEWRFSIAESPASNGSVERLVGSLKKALYKTMASTSRLDLETLTTIFLECCAIVNSRPICRPETLDKSTVTPAMLCSNRDLSALPFDSRKVNKECTFSKMELYRKQLICAFWRCWRRDYLMRLRVPNYQKEGEDVINVGDIVIVFDKDTAKGKWKLARVRDLKKSADGRTRRVELDTPHSTIINRHVNDLALLEADADLINHKK